MKSYTKIIERIRSKLLQRLDEDDTGHWVTTKQGKKIHINENGAVDKGNQFSLAVMGKPKGASVPKKKIAIQESKPYKLSPETRESLGEALSSRKDKGVVFGGFYKVEESGGTYRSATFFNPYTGDYFSEMTDSDDDRVYHDSFYSELRKMDINKDVAWLWNRCNGKVQSGDKIRVVKGRTIAHGTEDRVTSVRPYKDKYGRWVADYAYLEGGGKININNIEIVDED